MRPSADISGMRRMRLHASLSGASGIWALTGVTAVAALGLSFGWVRHLESTHLSFRISWPIIAVLFALSEAFVVHLQFRRGDAHSFSLNEIVIVLGLFFTDPFGLVLAQLSGAAVTLVFVRRQQPIKVAFNLSHLTLETAVAATVFASLSAGLVVTTTAGWLVALAATTLAAMIAGLLVGAVISIAQGRLSLRAAGRNLGLAFAVAVCNTSLGLVAVTVLARDPSSAWLLIAPVVVVFFSYRGYTRQRQKREGLEFLYESGRSLQREHAVEGALLTLLEQARTMFRAEIAQVTFFGADGEAATRTTLGPGEHTSASVPVQLDPREGVWARIASERQSILLPRPIRNERLREHFASRGMHDAMVAPVYGDAGVVGTIVVGNRLGDVSTFDEDDLRLFETLANHAGTTLQNVRLVARLEEALERMTEMNRMKDDFVATVSHELRTPLTSIQGFVQTMLRRDVDFSREDRHEFLTVIERQTRRLRELIEDLLIVSRFETDEVLAAPAVVSIPELVRRVGDEFAARGGVERLRFELAEGLPLITTDHDMLHRVLSNLVDNALKYSPESAPVAVHASPQGAGVKISVSDSGDGIPEAMSERIFERFFQVDQTKTREVGGTGLGLYICRQLTGTLRGRLWLERTGPGGSVFSMWVPDLTAAAADGLRSANRKSQASLAN